MDGSKRRDGTESGDGCDAEEEESNDDDDDDGDVKQPDVSSVIRYTARCVHSTWNLGHLGDVPSGETYAVRMAWSIEPFVHKVRYASQS